MMVTFDEECHTQVLQPYSYNKNDFFLCCHMFKNNEWMDELGFYIPSTVFRDDGRVNMKGSVQWSAV